MPPSPVAGVCSSIVRGPQPAPVTVGACDVGTPSSVIPTGSPTVNYTWTCGGMSGGPASPVCTASYTPPVPTCNSISVTPTTGNTPVSSTVSCNTSYETTVSIDCGNSQTISGKTGVCSYTTAGTYAPRCIVNGSISGPACTASVTATTPPVSVFDLRLKKYVNSDDAQPANPVSVNHLSTFNYIIRVTNSGPANVSGTTTVVDTLPAGIDPNGNIAASGWSCDAIVASRSITCTRSDTLGS